MGAHFVNILCLTEKRNAGLDNLFFVTPIFKTFYYGKISIYTKTERIVQCNNNHQHFIYKLLLLLHQTG